MTLLQAGQLQPEVTVNGDLNILDAAVGALVSAFGYDQSTSTGLTYGYYGGVVLVNATPTPIAAGTVSLTASATNYVQRSPDGSSVTVNTTGWTPGMVPMAEVVTNATNITTVTDMRPSNTTKAGRLVIGVGAPTGVSVSTATTGGSLAASTAYEYQVTAVYPWGESAPSAPVSVTTGSSTSTNENTISWTVPTGALSVNVYGRVSGSIAKIANVAAGTTSYTDTGSVTPSGAPPANGSLSLSEAQANATILSFEGAITAATTVELPSRPQQWVASNETTGAFVLTLTTSGATNSGVAPAQGSAEIVYANGTNLIAASSSGGGGGGASGAVVVNTTGGTASLSPSQAANAIIQLEGTLSSNAEVEFPSGLSQVWELSNQTSGSYTVTAIVSGSTATPITCAQGATTTVWSDGTNLHVVSPAGAAGGDLTGSYPSPSLVASGVTAGSYTMADITVDDKGRVTAAANAPAAGGDLTGSYPNPSLVTTGVTAGTYPAPQITVDSKGRITSAQAIGGATATLPASPLVSGMVYQNTGTQPLTIVQPVTYSPTRSAAASCAVALGSSSTPSTIDTERQPAGAVAGSVRAFTLIVPPGWCYSFTTKNATLGTAVAFTGSTAFSGIAPSDFSEDPSTTSGLTWGYNGGIVNSNGTPTTVASGTVALTASATNYVELSATGAISVNQTGWTAGLIPLRKLTTSTSAITGDVDTRAFLAVYGVSSFNGRSGAVTLQLSDVTSVLSGGTLTGNLSFGGNQIQDYAEGVNSVTINAFAEPGSPAVSTATTGGSLAASTAYEYVLTAVYPDGESGPTSAVSVTTGSSTSTNSNTISWTVPSGATSVNVYGRVSGSLGLLANVSSSTTSFTDTGSVTPGVAPPSIQSQTIPFSASVQEITLNASSAITFSGVPASGVASMTLYITQGSSGGPFTVTWPAGTLWPGGTAPTLSTAAGAEDDIVLATVNGGTTWRGYLAGKGMAT